MMRRTGRKEMEKDGRIWMIIDKIQYKVSITRSSSNATDYIHI